MANLVDAPSYTPNEVLVLDASTPVEGAHDGAAYGGLGPDNQPHQQLANRSAYLKQQIEELRASFWGYFLPLRSDDLGGGLVSLPAEGIFHFPVVNLGVMASQNMVAQWGVFTSTWASGVSMHVVTLGQDATRHPAFSSFAPGLLWATAWPLAKYPEDSLTITSAWLPARSARDRLAFHVENSGPPYSAAVQWFAIGTV